MDSAKVLLVILCVLIGFFVLSKCNLSCSRKDGYTDAFECNSKCANTTDINSRAMCLEQCFADQLGNSAMRRMTPNTCQSQDDCASDEICITPGDNTFSNLGYCMNANEPGIPWKDIPSLKNSKENFVSPVSCPPHMVFDNLSGECVFRSGAPSVAEVLSRPFPPEPIVTIPGSTTIEYGVGDTSPFDTPMHLPGVGDRLQRLMTSQ